MIKRSFDLVLALIGLTILMPVFLILAIAIKLDSAGPIFFSQTRVGRNEKPFKLYKFRSMRIDLAAGPAVTSSDDPRITRVGRWTRSFKLDELPQLVNVLRGDMSIVGPRPEVPEFIAHYPEESRKTVLSVRPGLTDFAAIEFRDEEAMLEGIEDKRDFYVTQILPKKIAHYENYVAKQSLFLDCCLIFRTIAVVIHGQETK